MSNLDEYVPSGKTYTSQLAAESVKKHLSRTQNIVLTSFYADDNPKMFNNHYGLVYFSKVHDIENVGKHFDELSTYHATSNGHSKAVTFESLGTFQWINTTISQATRLIEQRFFTGVQDNPDSKSCKHFPEYCTVQPRFPALEANGFIERIYEANSITAVTKPNLRGMQEQVYGLTIKGKKHVVNTHPWQHYRASDINAQQLKGSL